MLRLPHPLPDRPRPPSPRVSPRKRPRAEEEPPSDHRAPSNHQAPSDQHLALVLDDCLYRRHQAELDKWYERCQEKDRIIRERDKLISDLGVSARFQFSCFFFF